MHQTAEHYTLSLDPRASHCGSPAHSLARHHKGNPPIAGHTFLISVELRLHRLKHFFLRVQHCIWGTCSRGERDSYVPPFPLSLVSFSSLQPVNPSQEIRSPGIESVGGSRISTCSGELAHITIASETIPRILCVSVCESVRVWKSV